MAGSCLSNRRGSLQSSRLVGLVRSQSFGILDSDMSQCQMPGCVRVNVSAQIIDGKDLGKKIQEEVSERVSLLKGRGVAPHLAVVIAGEDPASHVYVRNKERACDRCGIISTRIDMPGSSNLEEILEVVNTLNSDPISTEY